MHMFDAMEDGLEPWHTCHSGFCEGRVSHESCSLINAHLPHVYHEGVGWILSPHTTFVCSYTGDGGTQKRWLGGCNEREPCWRGHWWGCRWGEEQLRDALETQLETNPGSYNEYIVAADYWEEHLPEIVVALLCHGTSKECDAAHSIHARFLAAYNRSAAQVPLVYYNGTYGRGFSLL